MQNKFNVKLGDHYKDEFGLTIHFAVPQMIHLNDAFSFAINILKCWLKGKFHKGTR